MLQSRRITADEHERFIAFNQHNSGAEVTPAYLAKAQVRIFVRASNPGQWIAGYVLNTQPPFRCLSVLDDAKRAELLEANHISENELVEITLLSRDRTIRWSSIERYQYYVMSIWDALRTGYPYLLGGTANSRLVGVLMAVLNHILYAGELNFFGQPKKVWLIYGARNQAFRNLARYILGQLWSGLRPGAASDAPQPSAGV